MRPRHVITVLILLLLLRVPPSLAQCTPQWLPGQGVPGVDGHIRTMRLWDPDGAGPLPAELVVGGMFSMAGNVTANNIARWNGVSWLAFGEGMQGLDDSVNAIEVLTTGQLVAGGSFDSWPDNGSVRVWDGSVWTSLDVVGYVSSLAVLPDGSLIVAGGFTQAGGVSANNIARWMPGTPGTWSAFGSGTNDWIEAVAVLPTGEVIAGGRFTTAGGVPASHIARWNGSSWSALGTGLTGQSVGVNDLLVLSGGDLVVAGHFTTAGGEVVNHVARWSPSQPEVFAPLGDGFPDSFASVASIVESSDESLLVCGDFRLPGLETGVARWNGDNWQPVGDGLYNYARVLALNPSGRLFVGGSFLIAGGIGVGGIAACDLNSGEHWFALGEGTNGLVKSLFTTSNGALWAGGPFTAMQGATACQVAVLDSGAWTPLGPGLGPVPVAMSTGVSAFTEMFDGRIVAGGVFSQSGSISVRHIASWNGSTWEPLGSGSPFGISALASMPDQSIIAAGGYLASGGPMASIARWDGATWSPLANGVDSVVSALLVLPTGELIVGGSFTEASGVPANRIAKWDGASWSPLGGGLSATSSCVVWSLASMHNGDIVAAGRFSSAGGLPANNVARWNGAIWQPLSAGLNGDVVALAVLSTGDLVAGGYFTMAGGVPAPRIAKWSPTNGQWSSLGSGIPGSLNPTSVSALAVLPNGNLAVGGDFTTAGGVTSAFFAIWGCECYANCDNSTGKPALTANDFQCFLDAFAGGNSYANCDASTGIPLLTSNDFQCFLNRFAAGCP